MRLVSPTLRRAPAVRAAVVALVATAATAGPAAGQLTPFAMELRGGVSVPVLGFGDPPSVPGELEAAPAFGARLVTRNVRGWGVAMGFGQRRFACRECPGSAAYVATDVEVEAVRSFGDERLAPWLSAGVAVGRTELDAAVPGGVERRLTDLAMGATAGAGVAVRVGGRLGLAPALRYGWMNTRVPGEGLLRMRHLLADVGVLLTF